MFKKSQIERQQACIHRADVRGPAHYVATFEILPDTSELTNGVAQRQVSIAPDILQAHLQIEHRRTSLQRTAFAWVHRFSYRSPLRKALLGP